MSFICQMCTTVQKHGVQPTRVTTHVREVEYLPRTNAHRDGNDDPGGFGTEIARELVACPACGGA